MLTDRDPRVDNDRRTDGTLVLVELSQQLAEERHLLFVTTLVTADSFELVIKVIGLCFVSDPDENSSGISRPDL